VSSLAGNSTSFVILVPSESVDDDFLPVTCLKNITYNIMMSNGIPQIRPMTNPAMSPALDELDDCEVARMKADGTDGQDCLAVFSAPYKVLLVSGMSSKMAQLSLKETVRLVYGVP